MISDSSPKKTKKKQQNIEMFFLFCSTVAVFGQSAAADVLPACKMRSEFGFHDAADGFISESGCALNGTEAMEIYDHEDWQDRQYPKRYTATANIWMYHSYPSFGGKKQLKSCGVTIFQRQFGVSARSQTSRLGRRHCKNREGPV